jgi:hypothetical protein
MAPPSIRLPLPGCQCPLTPSHIEIDGLGDGAAGFPLKPMLPVNVMLLPPSTKAPAAASNVRLFTVIPVRLLLFANCVLPAKIRPVGKLGRNSSYRRAPIIIRSKAGPGGPPAAWR